MNNNIVNSTNRITLTCDTSNAQKAAGWPSNEALKREEIIRQLSEFELGRHLLEHRSLDGYWTRYCVVEHPRNRTRSDIHPLEGFLLNSAPGFLATQERFGIFQTQLQKRLRDGMAIASVPCGYMDDLICLDYKDMKNMKLVGCDIDQKSCDGAFQNAIQHHLQNMVETHCIDAWKLGDKFQDSFDMLTSNGLNIYVEDAETEVNLYRGFYKALKRDGFLVTSFLTPPPALNAASPWKNFDSNALLKQRAIFVDALDVKWNHFNMPGTMLDKLKQAGFDRIEIHYDSLGMFPTVTAQKS